ncbi:Reducing polyketide synthase BOA9 [Metarhizium brunneum]|uniref:Reducing polyketide synthase BOA9 n=1 Tax=Metarhizium brunneum TaxID=500148 RepID=A0A7D5V4F9_9HYPO
MDATKSVLLDGSGAVLLASPNLNRPKLSGVTEKAVVIIEHTETGLGDSLQLAVTNTGAAAQRILFAHVTEATRLKEATAISLLEAELPLLAGITDSEMRRLKLLTGQAKNVLCVTAGDLLNGKTPQMGLAAGLSHALMLEKSSLRLMVYDTDKRAEADCEAQNLLQILTSSQMTGSDLEYVENDGTVHMARFVPDTKINALFQLAQDTTVIRLDPVHFRAIEPPPKGLAEDDIKMSVKAVGLNAKDLYLLTSKADTPGATCALEFSGVVDL